MKRTITLIYSLLMALSVAAQARFSSHTEQISMGQIEWKQPSTVSFLITNLGNQPLVLSHVEPDCDCSSVEWTVAVMTNASPHLVYLHFSGEVVTEIKDFTKTHPYQFGQIRVFQ